MWSEGDNFDLALSFQEKAGCDEIWEKICSVSLIRLFLGKGAPQGVDMGIHELLSRTCIREI